MLITVSHKLRIELGEGLPYAVEHLMVLPGPAPTQVIEDWKVDIEGIDEAARFTDAFGNSVLLVNQMRPAPVLVLTLEGQVTTQAGSGVVGRLPADPQPALFKRPSPLAKAPASLYARYRNAEASGTPVLEVLHGLMKRVKEYFVPEADDLEEAPANAADHAHVFIGAARALDIPARYVWGYWLGETEGEGCLHAWAEAWVDGLGWIGFDAMNDLCPSEEHIRVAVGFDAQTALPVRVVPPLADEAIMTEELSVTAKDGGGDSGQEQSQSQSSDGQSQSQSQP